MLFFNAPISHQNTINYINLSQCSNVLSPVRSTLLLKAGTKGVKRPQSKGYLDDFPITQVTDVFSLQGSSQGVCLHSAHRVR